MPIVKRLGTAFCAGLLICAITYTAEYLGAYLFKTSTTQRGMYAMWLVLGPWLGLFESDIRKLFWKRLLGALAAAILGMFIVTAALGKGPITPLRWLGAVAGNTIGFYFTLPVLLEIASFTKKRDSELGQTTENKN